MAKKLLLHICCGPDSTVPVPDLMSEGYDVTGYFFGSNIHPFREYELRKKAAEQVACEWGIALVEPPYDPESWLEKVRSLGLENEKEGGGRCAFCFRLQLQRASEEAISRGYEFLTTTLTISPHKDPILINSIGKEEAASRGITWVDKVFRKREGFKRSLAECRRLGLYRQNYCGCVYSMESREKDKTKV